MWEPPVSQRPDGERELLEFRERTVQRIVETVLTEPYTEPEVNALDIRTQMVLQGFGQHAERQANHQAHLEMTLETRRQQSPWSTLHVPEVTPTQDTQSRPAWNPDDVSQTYIRRVNDMSAI